MCLMTGLTTYSKTLCQFIEIVSRCVGDGGPRKKLSMQGVRGQAILLCEFIRLDFLGIGSLRRVHIYLLKINSVILFITEMTLLLQFLNTLINI